MFKFMLERQIDAFDHHYNYDLGYTHRMLGASFTPVNGMAGMLISDTAGQVVQTIAFEINDRSPIVAIYVQSNPEKLRHIVTDT